MNITDFKDSNTKDENKGEFDVLKSFQGKLYSGMRVGREHKWKYDNGIWQEKKLSPDKWKISFSCLKERFHQAPENSGCEIGSSYHWLIISDQIATKTSANHYNTKMTGFKFKIGHKRPKWKNFSYKYPEQLSYKEKVIEILETVLEQIKNS